MCGVRALEGAPHNPGGYALDRCVREPDNLNHLLCGSEGTLAAITSAELKIVPLPEKKGLGLIFFASVSEAMEATVALLDLKPAAIEYSRPGVRLSCGTTS